MELLVCMSIAGSIPVVICLLLYIIQRGNYNYILGRRLLLTGVFFYLVPVQLVKYLLPKDALPETMLIGKKADSYLSVLWLSGVKSRVIIYGYLNGLIYLPGSG